MQNRNAILKCKNDSAANGGNHALLNVTSDQDLLDQPWIGASWEGFVIEQILAAIQQLDLHVECHFFRTSDQHEIDLVLDFGRQLWACEIKLSTTPAPEGMDRLNKAADLIKADRRFLISQVKQSVLTDRQSSCDLETFLRLLAEN